MYKKEHNCFLWVVFLQFHHIQLTLLGHDLVNMRLEFGVCLEHFDPDPSLHRGFDLGLCARGQTVLGLVSLWGRLVVSREGKRGGLTPS